MITGYVIFMVQTTKQADNLSNCFVESKSTLTFLSLSFCELLLLNIEVVLISSCLLSVNCISQCLVVNDVSNMAQLGSDAGEFLLKLKCV